DEQRCEIHRLQRRRNQPIRNPTTTQQSVVQRRTETASGTSEWNQRVETTNGNDACLQSLFPFVFSIRFFHSPLPFGSSIRPSKPSSIAGHRSRSWRPGGRPSGSPCQPRLELVEVRVEHRRYVQRDDLRECEPADDRDTQRPP